jgi:hypothetical protein
MFPSGFAGVGLVLLRIAVAVPLDFDVLTHGKTVAPWLLVGKVAVSLALCAGLLTPLISPLVVAIQLEELASTGTEQSLLISLHAMVLALLGPGAYSFDAYRFGRRRVVWPPNDANTH